jgi:hypothetical protein
LPQPEGPMRAVIDFGSTTMEMLSIALNDP